MLIDDDLLLTEPRFLRLTPESQLVYLKLYALANKTNGIIIHIDSDIAFVLRMSLEQWCAIRDYLADRSLISIDEHGIRIAYWKQEYKPQILPSDTANKIREQEARMNARGSLQSQYPWVKKWQGRFAMEYDDRMLKLVVKYLKTTPAYAPTSGVEPSQNNAKLWLSKGLSLFIDNAPEEVQQRYQQCLNLWNDISSIEPTNVIAKPVDDTQETGKAYAAFLNADQSTQERLLAERKAVAKAFRNKIKGEQQ